MPNPKPHRSFAARVFRNCAAILNDAVPKLTVMFDLACSTVMQCIRGSGMICHQIVLLRIAII